MKHHLKKNTRKAIMTIVGSVIFCFGINMFITPLHLYSGGILGLSQVIRSVLAQFGLVFPFEISGILNLIFNLPLLYLAFTKISRRFFTLTILSVATQMVCFSILPIPTTPIIQDYLTACLVGGVVCGFGIGWILRFRGSAGGIDILAVYLTQKFNNFSIGKVSVIINTCLFASCALLFNVETAIYSVIYTFICGITIDRVHYQNINMTVMIFTKKMEVNDYIIQKMHRGVTFWEGTGGFTQEDIYIMVTAVNKYEINLLEKRIKRLDENAFIIFSEGMSVSGNFERRI